LEKGEVTQQLASNMDYNEAMETLERFNKCINFTKEVIKNYELKYLTEEVREAAKQATQCSYPMNELIANEVMKANRQTIQEAADALTDTVAYINETFAMIIDMLNRARTVRELIDSFARVTGAKKPTTAEEYKSLLDSAFQRAREDLGLPV